MIWIQIKVYIQKIKRDSCGSVCSALQERLNKEFGILNTTNTNFQLFKLGRIAATHLGAEQQAAAVSRARPVGLVGLQQVFLMVLQVEEHYRYSLELWRGQEHWDPEEAEIRRTPKVP